MKVFTSQSTYIKGDKRGMIKQVKLIRISLVNDDTYVYIYGYIDKLILS